MDLVKLEKQLPLRAYPEQELNKVIIMDLMPFVSGLLSLTDEVSAQRLKIALPAIKEQCIGMGFHQIKRMFEMYVDSKLNLKPIPNYFDRILLGKIVDSYKALNAVKPKKIEVVSISDQEKDFIMTEAVDRVKKEVKQNGFISGSCSHIYDYLDKQGKLPKDADYKNKIYEQAKALARGEAATKARYSLDDHKNLNKVIESIEKKGNSNVINISKRLVLESYFNKLNK
jgi:hypothetical protein